MNNDLCFAFSIDHASTAPFNEVEARFSSTSYDGAAQRHDNEATDPDHYTQTQLEAGKGDTPDGFYWSADPQGKALLRPLSSTISGLHELCLLNFEEYEEDRDAGLPRDKTLFTALSKMLKSIKAAQAVEVLKSLADAFTQHPDAHHFEKQCELAKARIDKVNEWVGNSYARSIMKQAETEFATAVYWLHIHRQAMERHEENGNERAAEESLIRYEASRTQMLIAGQLLDWAKANDFKPDMQRGARSALSLRGWKETQKIASGDKPKAKESFLEGVNW